MTAVANAKQAASTAEERASRSVFVGNIPYEATEEQLKEIFQQAGAVVSFRLVYDRETGKPKGYGFCEYQDIETAQSAMRNLNNHDFNGRPLRVGVAAGEQNKDENKSLQQAIGGPLIESPYGEPVPSDEAPEAISKAVASLPPEQMFELMKQMKLCIQNNPNEARNMLQQNPQLAYALLQGQIVMKIVDPQVALAMLHRQTEQIPPLLPTSQNQTDIDLPTSKAQDVDHRIGLGPPGSVAPGVRPPNPIPASSASGMPPAGRGGMPGGLMNTGGGMGSNLPGSMGPGPRTANTNMPLNDPDYGRGGGGRMGPGPGRGRGGLLDDRPPEHHRMDVTHSPMDDDVGPPAPHNRGFAGDPRDPRARGEMAGRGPAPGGGPMRGDMNPYGNRPGGDMGGPHMGSRPAGPRPDFRDPRQAGGGDPRNQRGMGQGPRQPAPAGGLPPHSAPSMPGLAGLAGGGQDQEKAALIMQVLQLSDEQISLLPPDQRQSILILKEQIARAK